MPKGVIERSGGRTAASDLRDMLRELEVGAGDLVGKGEEILTILRLRDRVQDERWSVCWSKASLKPEESRLETIDSCLRGTPASSKKSSARRAGWPQPGKRNIFGRQDVVVRRYPLL